MKHKVMRTRTRGTDRTSSAMCRTPKYHSCTAAAANAPLCSRRPQTDARTHAHTHTHTHTHTHKARKRTLRGTAEAGSSRWARKNPGVFLFASPPCSFVKEGLVAVGVVLCQHAFAINQSAARWHSLGMQKSRRESSTAARLQIANENFVCKVFVRFGL